MTTEQLREFIAENEIEIDWRDKNKVLYAWIPFYLIDEFANGLAGGIETEDEVMVYLQENVICVDLVPLCENYGILPEDVKAVE